MKKRLAVLFSTIITLVMIISMFPACGGAPAPTDESVLEKISVTTQASKVDYTIGDDFDATGMVVTAYFDDGAELIVTDYELKYNEDMADGASYVQIAYTYGGVTKYAYEIITVTEVHITSITFATPTCNSYVEGEPFDSTGFGMTANYSNGESETIYNYTIKTETVPASGEIQVDYAGETYTYKTNVRNATIKSISVNMTEGDIYEGDLYQSLVQSIVVTYSDSVTRTITSALYTSDQTEPLTASDTSATISYGGFDQVVSFTVIAVNLQSYKYEAEGLALSSTANSNIYSYTQSISLSDVTTGTGSTVIEAGSPGYSGLGYLDHFASTAHTMSLNFTSSRATTATLYITSKGSYTVGSLFSDIMVNGESITEYSSFNTNGTFLNEDDPLTEEVDESAEFVESSVATIMLDKGANVLDFKGKASVAQEFDFVRLTSGAEISLTNACEKDWDDIAWMLEKAPTETETGLIYKYCPDCMNYEEVEIPTIGSAGLTVGGTVAPTEFENGYKAYTYVSGGETYSFKETTYEATGDYNSTYMDFEDAVVEKYDYAPRVELFTNQTSIDEPTSSGGTVTKTPTSSPSASSDITEDGNFVYISSTNALFAPYAGDFTHGFSTRASQSKFTFTFTASKDSAGELYVCVAGNQSKKMFLGRHFRAEINGEVVNENAGIIPVISNSGYFRYNKVYFGDLDLQEGVNTIELISLGGVSTNIDGLFIDSPSTISYDGSITEMNDGTNNSYGYTADFAGTIYDATGTIY